MSEDHCSTFDQGASLILHLSPELMFLRDYLGRHLDDLKEILNLRELFVLMRAKADYHAVMSDFLEVVSKYVGDTLEGLLEIVANLSEHVEIYDCELPDFILRANITLQGIDDFSNKVQGHVDRQTAACEDVAALSLRMRDLIKEYLENIDTHTEKSTTLRITSIGLALLGTVTVGICFTPLAIGHRAVVGAAALVAGGGGTIGCEAIAQHDQRKAKTYANAIARLVEAQGYNDSLKEHMLAILQKLKKSKRHLEKLKEETTRAMPSQSSDEEIDAISERQVAYRLAQKEAMEIRKLCIEIGQYAGTIETLRVEVKVRRQKFNSFEGKEEKSGKLKQIVCHEEEDGQEQLTICEGRKLITHKEKEE
ncbi:hypothetical protein EMPS_03200 [Entomortierella parvispora]|uniref:Uncharacterized protein n=1 Tax=Entomortierella parvispora TaxID=205924 RepID=A0A9P3H6C1_9FUNG|nr:hypothetical protein EMPS_03200 [Entomortierella parvispora]